MYRDGRAIQQKILPTAGACGRMEWAVYYEPSRWVGGDYVDAARITESRAFLAVADVCGKGLQASLVTSSLHTLVRTGLKARMPLPMLMQLAHDHMVEYLPEGSFVTMLGTCLEGTTGEAEFCNAGHPPVAIIAPDGEIREIGNGDAGFNMPLGIGNEAITSGQFTLAPGETMAIYTDGLTDLEDQNGAALGDRQLLTVLRNSLLRHSGNPLVDAIGSFSQAIDAYRNGRLPIDDRTLLLCRRT